MFVWSFMFALLSSLSKPSAACFSYYQQLELDYKNWHTWQLSIYTYATQYVDDAYRKVKIYPHESSAQKQCNMFCMSCSFTKLVCVFSIHCPNTISLFESNPRFSDLANS